MKYLKISSGAPWEKIVGYSRAVKIGNQIEISGTVATDGAKTIAVGNAYGQAKYIIEKIEGVLKDCGANLTNVVRTRIYVTDISQWQEIGRAHGEFFKDVKPATSMVQVARLIEDDYLVEIEATAILQD